MSDGAPASISVVVAVYNGAALVGDALRSILGQTRPPDEVCVVDDGSTDGTAGVVRAFGDAVRLVRLDANGGQAAALNRGVAETAGACLAFLDADDVWRPDKLERQARALDEDPALDAVYGLMREEVTGADGTASAASAEGPGGAAGVPPEIARRHGVERPAWLPSAMLIRRAAFARVGGFDPRWTLGSVVDWYARACEAGLAQHALDAVVYVRRIHGANLGIKAARHRADYLSVVKAALDRRRGRAGS